MNMNISDQEKKLFINHFKCPIYSIYDWEKVIKQLKKRNKDEIIDITDKTLRKSYRNKLPYPIQCCDFATDFGFIIFKDLGYDVKIFQNFNNGEHNFLLLDNEGIDFTSKQFEELLPIRNIDLNLSYYKNSHEHIERGRILSIDGYKRFYKEAKEQTLTGVMNYVPFSYIIEKIIYEKK